MGKGGDLILMCGRADIGGMPVMEGKSTRSGGHNVGRGMEVDVVTCIVSSLHPCGCTRGRREV